MDAGTVILEEDQSEGLRLLKQALLEGKSQGMVSRVVKVLKTIIECLEKEIYKFGSRSKKIMAMELCLKYIDEAIDIYNTNKYYKPELQKSLNRKVELMVEIYIDRKITLDSQTDMESLVKAIKVLTLFKILESQISTLLE